MRNGIQLPVPDGNPHIPIRSIPEVPPKPDWASRIQEIYKHEDEKPLCDKLKVYKNAGYPRFVVRNWLSTLENLAKILDRTVEWRQKRMDLLLRYFDDTHRLELLHGAIDCIKAEDNKPFVPLEDDKPMYFVVEQLIQGNPELAFQPFSRQQPAFMIAASQGAVHIVEFVLEKLRSLLEVGSATSEGKLSEDLFNRLSVHDQAANTSLALAVQEGHTDIVCILLNTERRLACPQYLKDTHIKEALGKCKIEILTMVLHAQPDIAKRLPELIVQVGGLRCEEMWKAMAPQFEEFLQESDILHLAVQERQVDIIRWLVSKFPKMATRKDREGRIALWYNNDQKQCPRTALIKEDIRGSIVPEIVRLCNAIETKDLLRVANDTPRQASLDLRVLNQETHDFAYFIESVKANTRTPSGLNVVPDPKPNIQFESVLRYVHFPELSQEPMSGDHRREQQAVPSILSWLRQKGVERILKLVVPDSRANALDEDTIRSCLDGFVVEDLDWRRLDLGIEPIASLASTLGVLHLYSSGSWAVLSHWVSEGGLEKLKELRELHITLVEECMSESQTKSCLQRTTEQIDALKSRLGWAWSPVITKEHWSRGTNLIKKVNRMINAVDSEEKSASSCIGLEAFVAGYTDIQQGRLEKATNSNLKPLRKIKIALIDTGVGAMGDRSQLQIKEGISFVHGADGESESPWWIPSNEHGPQMADIICAIDPYCEIYPVKVTDERAVKDPRPIADAIKWATERDVDIISLSLVLFNSHSDLYDAINTANQKNIVIICSTADKGNNEQKVYPATYWKKKKIDCLIPIAGCDQYGKLTDWSTLTEAKYHFRGKDVTAKPGRLMRNSGNEISGSSVATAIAAGTASLVLACSLLALEEEKYSRKQRIEYFFKNMQTEENLSHKLKYVEPAIIFGEKKITGTTLKRYIEQTFSRIDLPD